MSEISPLVLGPEFQYAFCVFFGLQAILEVLILFLSKRLVDTISWNNLQTNLSQTAGYF